MPFLDIVMCCRSMGAGLHPTKGKGGCPEHYSAGCLGGHTAPAGCVHRLSARMT